MLLDVEVSRQLAAVILELVVGIFVAEQYVLIRVRIRIVRTQISGSCLIS